MDIQITTPFTKEAAQALKAGDRVLITGTIYTARDAAHARLIELLDKGEALPVDLTDGIVYYVGPTPAKPGQVIGSAGPTTATRMDVYTPKLIAQGMRGMIGKGKRFPAVIDAIKEHGAVYFGAIGGVAAYLSKCVLECEVVCYEDLGAEAIHRLKVKDFPATVVIDTQGNNLLDIGVDMYLAAQK